MSNQLIQIKIPSKEKENNNEINYLDINEEELTNMIKKKYNNFSNSCVSVISFGSFCIC